MTMLKPALIGAALLAFAPFAQAQPAQIGQPAVTARTDAGRQVIEIDMAALADPAPPRGPSRLAAAPAATPAAGQAEAPAPTNGTPPPRKRFAHKIGQYEDAPMIALLGSIN
jgi:hypothetical protein